MKFPSSIKTKVLLAGAAFLLSFVLVLITILYVNVRNDLEDFLSGDSFSEVSRLAASLEHELITRRDAVQRGAEIFPADGLRNPERALKFLRDRVGILSLFPHGLAIVDQDGLTIADLPENSGRRGTNVSSREWFRELRETRHMVIAEPYIGGATKRPVLVIAAPLLEKGEFRGALAATVYLDQPNFLRSALELASEEEALGRSLFLLSKKSRQMVMATNHAGVLQPLEKVNLERIADRYLANFSGSGHDQTASGTEALTAAKHLVVVPWLVLAATPVEVAFKPAYRFLNSALVLSGLFTLVALLAMWFLAQFFLRPVEKASRAIQHNLAHSDLLSEPIPLGGTDEVRTLLTGFQMLQVALREKIREMSAILENSSVGITLVRDRKIVWANPRMAEIFRYDAIQMNTLQTRDFYLSDANYAALGEEGYRSLSNGERYVSEQEMRCRDDHRLWVRISGKAIDSTDLGKGSIWIFEDIDQQKQAEAELWDYRRKIEALLAAQMQHQQEGEAANALRRALLDNSAVGIFLVTPEREIVEVSRRMCEMFGYSASEFVGETSRLIHLDDEHFIDFGKNYSLFDAKTQVGFEYPFRHRDGHVIWCAVDGAPLDPKDLSKGFIWSFLDINERRRLAEESEKDRRLLRDIVDSIPAAVSYWSAQDMHDIRNVFSNRVYAAMYETTPEKLVGVHVRDLLGQEIYDAHWGKMIQARSGEHIVYERYQPSVNGKPPRHVHVHYIPDIPQGKPQGLYVMMFDTTDMKNAEEALIRAKVVAEDAVLAKSQFLANMSHEIRTPMNAILGMTNLVLDSELSNRQRDYLLKVSNAAKVLLLLLNDILDYSKLEAGQLKIEHVPFALSEVIRSVEDIFSFRLHEKKLKWTVEKPVQLVDSVIGDPLRLGQVLINLVGNAVKFTDSGEITLAIAEQAKTADSITLKISVTDTGIGMRPEEQQRIFEAFSQADSSVSRKYGGTGLGLSITKQIVGMMGGTIEVVSEQGIGSTFSFTATLGRHQGNAPFLNRDIAPLGRIAELALHETAASAFVPVLHAELRPASPEMLAELVPKLAELSERIAHNNFAARGLAEEIETMLAGTELEAMFHPVMSAVRKLIFREAAKHLLAFQSDTRFSKGLA